MMRFDPRNPLDFAPFTADFVNILPPADTIVAASVDTMPPDLTVAAVSFQGTQVTVWLSGGSDGTDYEVTYAVTTADGLHEVRPTALLVTTEL